MTIKAHENVNEKQVRLVVENWAAAVRVRDVHTILANHSSDIVMYDVPEPFQSAGIGEYAKSWDLFFKYTKPGVFDILEMHIVADEQVGFCFAKMKCEDKSNSMAFEPLDFRLTIGLKKINNEWIIMHEHHSIPAGK